MKDDDVTYPEGDERWYSYRESFSFLTQSDFVIFTAV